MPSNKPQARPRTRFYFVAAALLLAGGCASDAPSGQVSAKVTIDLSGLNAEGLRGPAPGLRAAHYEFCIPSGGHFTREVGAIDPTARFMPGSRGRIGCGKEEVLVAGSTHQRDYRQVLDRLAALSYVRRIQESFFE